MTPDDLPRRSLRFGSTLPFRALVQNYFAIIHALVMHDIKNRFFGSGLGQIVFILWPFVHMIVLLTMYTVTRRPAPYGEGAIQYSAVSIYPFICFTYVSRWIVFSGVTNRSFLQYPVIRPLDLLLARAILEVVSISVVGILLIITVMALGYDTMPNDGAQATYAFCAVTFLAIGMGVLNGAIAMAVPIWLLVYTLIIILAYVSSGVLFVASTLPEQIRVPLSYNPLLNCTEWFRSAYYADYPTTVLDRGYVLGFSLTALTAGLLLERLLRRIY